MFLTYPCNCRTLEQVERSIVPLKIQSVAMACISERRRKCPGTKLHPDKLHRSSIDSIARQIPNLRVFASFSDRIRMQFFFMHRVSFVKPVSGWRVADSRYDKGG